MKCLGIVNIPSMEDTLIRLTHRLVNQTACGPYLCRKALIKCNYNYDMALIYLEYCQKASFKKCSFEEYLKIYYSYKNGGI